MKKLELMKKIASCLILVLLAFMMAVQPALALDNPLQNDTPEQTVVKAFALTTIALGAAEVSAAPWMAGSLVAVSVPLGAYMHAQGRWGKYGTHRVGESDFVQQVACGSNRCIKDYISTGVR